MAFHWIPARHGQSAQAELNAALHSLRVVSVEKHFCPHPPDPGWAVCVEYVDSVSGTATTRPSGAKTVDYREVLDPETFAVFAALRELRKKIAAEEGVPIYAIMTNEQLAAVAQRRCQSLSDLESLEGLGPARARKHGPRFLETVRQSVAEQTRKENAHEPNKSL
ncbi:MAG: HRDC domain-containing protein [Verrucomicrobiota bacterium]